MAVKAVINVSRGGVKVTEARTSGGEVVLVHDRGNGQEEKLTISPSGKRSSG